MASRPGIVGILDTGQLGTVAELRVSADLIKLGYHVFRALSPSCPCDLVIVRGVEVLRVEVRTGRYSDGRLLWARCSRVGCHDVMAVFCDGEITYEPDLERHQERECLRARALRPCAPKRIKGTARDFERQAEKIRRVTERLNRRFRMAQGLPPGPDDARGGE